MAVKRRRKVKMGRPPSPPEEVRRNILTIKLTDAEWEALMDRSEAIELPPGSVARRLVGEALLPPKRRAKR